MQIDKHKLRVNMFTVELDEPLDRNLRTLVTTEVDIYSVETQDNNDGEYTQVYKAKVNGTTITKQGEEKVQLAKSKRSHSVRWRLTLRDMGYEEDDYQKIMNAMIADPEDVINYLIKEGKVYL